MTHSVERDPPAVNRNIHNDTPNSSVMNGTTINIYHSNKDANLLKIFTNPLQKKLKSNPKNNDLVYLKTADRQKYKYKG